MLNAYNAPVFHVGEIVRTNYATGPYRIIRVSESCCCPRAIDSTNMRNPPTSKPHFHLTCELLNKKGHYYLNGYLPTGENVWGNDRLIFPLRSQPFGLSGIDGDAGSPETIVEMTMNEQVDETESRMEKRVLDPCCGSRMMWFNRQHPDVVFGDQRNETVTVTDRSNGNASGTRILRIEPDTLIDFRALPYPDESFKLVAFDPPHLHTAGPKSWLAAKYGKLSENWRDDLCKGFSECFRVLDANGVLVFKWNETQVKLRDVLALTAIQPLFGHPTGRKGLTHWLVFMKPAG